VSLEVSETIADLRAHVAAARSRGLSIALVPTMGALHEGHGRLMERARLEAGLVIVTVFVNPIQFNEAADYSKYPRSLDADLLFCAARGVDLVFAPAIEEMYPRRQHTFVEVGPVADPMEGRFRPGHFRGVATVVAKLFNIVQPDRAYFGEKDAQQLAVIRRMAEDLNFPVTIVEVPTVRESSGLAMSSRNRLLTSQQRGAAGALHEALLAAAHLVSLGESSAAAVKQRGEAVLGRYPEIRPEYFEIVDPADMQPVETIAGPVRIACAAWVGSTRLIDNVLATPAGRQ